MMHAIGRQLPGHECVYTPYFSDGLLRWMSRKGYLDWTILGGAMRDQTVEYLRDHRLPVVDEGGGGPYDLILTGSDLLVQRNIRGRPVVLVQEGMTDPETLGYRLVRRFGLPRWIASTATTGLSGAYERFCVASEGYRDHFVRKGAPRDRIVVTGIPNFDNCRTFLDNDFPHRGYVLVATSDSRETLKRDDRPAFLARVREIAAGREVIFKLHPNERPERSIPEIQAAFPGALVIHQGRIEPMIANCDVLITQWSTVVYVGLALGKECHSAFDLEELRALTPVQNGGDSARRIAAVCEAVLAGQSSAVSHAWRAAS
jgi:hypothetical protein